MNGRALCERDRPRPHPFGAAEGGRYDWREVYRHAALTPTLSHGEREKRGSAAHPHTNPICCITLRSFARGASLIGSNGKRSSSRQ
jgi:hypothetical protein